MAHKDIVIIGGGMTATYLLQHFVEQGATDCRITIIEKDKRAGVGMPYDRRWVDDQHLANLSSDEIANTRDHPLHEWLAEQDDDRLNGYGIAKDSLTKPDAGSLIFPRVVLGDYFEEDRFNRFVEEANKKGIEVRVLRQTEVTDMKDEAERNKVAVTFKNDQGTTTEEFDQAVIATGHRWPSRKENQAQGYFASPWPASKLRRIENQTVGILGSSLTAVDTVLTLARQHGYFSPKPGGGQVYTSNAGMDKFKMIMHSRRGRLPYLRFDFEFKEFDQYRYVSRREIERRIEQDTLTLDFFFDAFKTALNKKDSATYDEIKDMNLEQFVAHMDNKRSGKKPFNWFKEEYATVQRSFEKQEPIFWREVLLDVVYTMNFYAKHLSAEDMIRYKQELLPFLSDVVAFLPQQSAEQLTALHDAGKLDLVALGLPYSITRSEGQQGASIRFLGKKTRPDIDYPVFVEALGQQPMRANADRFSFPFKSLVDQGIATKAEVRFRRKEAAEAQQPKGVHEPSNRILQKGGDSYLLPGGVSVDDKFRLVDKDGHGSPRIFDIANSHIMGLYPFNEGLAFCDNIAQMVVSEILRGREPAQSPRPRIVRSGDGPSAVAI